MMELRTVSIDKLVASEHNVNKMHPLRQKALRHAVAQGFRDPIEICPLTQDFPEWRAHHGDDHYLIVDGHHRVKAAHQNGEATVTALCYEYTPKDAKLRNLQTATLRGTLNPINAARTIVALEGEGMELVDIAEEVGVPLDELEEMKVELDDLEAEAARENSQREAQLEIVDNWRTIEIQVPPENYDLVMNALAKCRKQLTHPGAYAIIDAIRQTQVDDKRGALEDLLIALTTVLIQQESGDGITMQAEPSAAFRKALTRAKKLADTRHKGRALEVIVADFMATPDESFD